MKRMTNYLQFFSSLMVILSVQVLIIFCFLFFYCYPGKQLCFSSPKVLLSISSLFWPIIIMWTRTKKQKSISSRMFSTLEYVQRHVSPFPKANSSPVRNILGFPMFQPSTQMLGSWLRHVDIVTSYVYMYLAWLSFVCDVWRIAEHSKVNKFFNIGKIIKLRGCRWELLASLKNY